MALQFPNTATTGLNLGLANIYAGVDFTISVWIRRTATGTAISIGTGGQTSLEPIFTGGVGEADTPNNLNCAFGLGWIPASSKIGVDFEDANNGLNHPFTFNSALSNNVDYHICTTYDHNTGIYIGYVNGVADGTTTVTGTELVRSPATSSIQGTGVSCAINSSGTRTGAFVGLVWNAAMWNTSLTATDVEMIAKSKITGIELQIKPNKLRCLYPMDNASDGSNLSTTANIIMDISGRGKTGTAFGTIVGKAHHTNSYL